MYNNSRIHVSFFRIGLEWIVLQADLSEVVLAVEDHFLSPRQYQKLVYDEGLLLDIKGPECERPHNSVRNRWSRHYV